MDQRWHTPKLYTHRHHKHRSHRPRQDKSMLPRLTPLPPTVSRQQAPLRRFQSQKRIQNHRRRLKRLSTTGTRDHTRQTKTRTRPKKHTQTQPPALPTQPHRPRTTLRSTIRRTLLHLYRIQPRWIHRARILRKQRTTRN